MTHLKVCPSGLVFSGDPETEKYYSIYNTLPLNKLNESYFYIILILIFHTPPPSPQFFPANCLQAGYFSWCPRNNKSEIYQREVCLRVRRPCRRSPLSVCLCLNKDVLSLIRVNTWTWNKKVLSIQRCQRFRALSFRPIVCLIAYILLPTCETGEMR